MSTFLDLPPALLRGPPAFRVKMPHGRQDWLVTDGVGLHSHVISAAKQANVPDFGEVHPQPTI